MAITKVTGELVDLNEATSESGLKIPSGTELNRPTDATGQIRNNTNETSDGSASCEEYYNGTEWKKINNVALPVYFKSVTYTGTGSTQSITGLGFQPDLIWLKNTSNVANNVWVDSLRGRGTVMYTNSSSQEAPSPAGTDVASFDSDGFTLGTNNNGNINTNGNSYIAYCWRANGGNNSTNTDGTITSTVQVNDDAGFSIVQFTTNGNAASRVGHGLAQTPDVVLYKQSSHSASWWWYTSLIDGSFDYIQFNGTGAKQNSSGTAFNSTTIFAESGSSGKTMMAYCFYSVAGFSKFGTYTGTGSSNSITGLGFQPSFVIVKCTSNGPEDWPVFASSLPNNYIAANSDATAQSFTFSFDSDGFTVPASSGMTNGSGRDYIYFAFK